MAGHFNSVREIYEAVGLVIFYHVFDVAAILNELITNSTGPTRFGWSSTWAIRSDPIPKYAPDLKKILGLVAFGFDDRWFLEGRWQGSGCTL